MPVESSDLLAATSQYALDLQGAAGTPPVLDLVHLGLGPDGHTASLVPGDSVLNVTTADVALTGAYQGRRRMTLTYPMINRARRLVWVVTGSEKTAALQRLLDGDVTIPAGRVRREEAVLFADRAGFGLKEDLVAHLEAAGQRKPRAGSDRCASIGGNSSRG
jgi:6-phosphogluconolactonase/glucosamine-6-phosphate isomerase/deaminase